MSNLPDYAARWSEVAARLLKHDRVEFQEKTKKEQHDLGLESLALKNKTQQPTLKSNDPPYRRYVTLRQVQRCKVESFLHPK